MQALRFYGSNGVTVTGITIQNSQQTHLKFDDCTAVQVSGFTALSPGDSPNTDGIHLQNSQDVLIYGSTLACGNFQNQQSNRLTFFPSSVISNLNMFVLSQEMIVYRYKLDVRMYTYTMSIVGLDMELALGV